jgi:predicted nucleic acid-binding protein
MNGMIENRIEVFSKPTLPSDEEDNFRSFLSEKIIIIDLTSEIKKETIALRRSTKIKLPDSIVAATSIVLDAVLLTEDKALLNLSWPGFRAQSIL